MRLHLRYKDFLSGFRTVVENRTATYIGGSKHPFRSQFQALNGSKYERAWGDGSLHMDQTNHLHCVQNWIQGKRQYADEKSLEAQTELHTVTRGRGEALMSILWEVW